MRKAGNISRKMGGFLENGYPYTILHQSNDDHRATRIQLAGHATYETTQAGVSNSSTVSWARKGSMVHSTRMLFWSPCPACVIKFTWARFDWFIWQLTRVRVKNLDGWNVKAWWAIQWQQLQLQLKPFSNLGSGSRGEKGLPRSWKLAAETPMFCHSL